MNNRVNRKMLQRKFELFCKLVNRPEHVWTTNSDGKRVSTPGSLILEKAPVGWRIVEISNENGGENTPFGSSSYSASELWNLMDFADSLLYWLKKGIIMPRQRIREDTVYKFEELSDEAKAHAIEKFWEINVDYEWWENDFWLEPTEAELEKLGMKREDIKGGYNQIFSYDDIYFSIDREWCLSFKNLTVNDDEAFRKLLGVDETLWKKAYISFSSTRGREPDTILCYEENDSEDEFTDEEQAILDAAVDKFADMRENALRAIQKEYEWQTSEEQIIESIIANGFEFDEKGDLA